MKKLLVVTLLMLLALTIYLQVVMPIHLQRQLYQHELEHYVNGIRA